MRATRLDLILYGTYGCHLCDQARETAMPAVAAGRISLQDIDIFGDAALEARYGIRIPVLRHAGTQQELNWPFDLGDLDTFISRLQGASG